MFNVPIKHILLTAATAVLMASCGGAGNDNDRAQALVDEATHALESRQYTLAATLLDSVNNAYPHAIEARRETMHLMTLAREGMTLDEMRQADSLRVVYQILGDSLARRLELVRNPVENYFVGPGQNVDARKATGLYGRMMPDGTIYMISTLVGRKSNHTSVTVSRGGESATTATITFDGEQNDRSGGVEMINYTGSECDTIARFIAANPGAAYSLTFNGSTPVTLPLPDGQRNAIALIAEYHQALENYRRQSALYDALNQRLEVIRSQMARTYRDSTDLKSN